MFNKMLVFLFMNFTTFRLDIVVVIPNILDCRPDGIFENNNAPCPPKVPPALSAVVNANETPVAADKFSNKGYNHNIFQRLIYITSIHPLATCQEVKQLVKSKCNRLVILLLL